MSTTNPATRPPVPDTLEEALTPAWLSTALATSFPGIEVTAVEGGPIVSRVSTNARFTIECDGGVPDGLSPNLCVKGYFTDLGQREARSAGVPEVCFYRDLATPTGVRTLRSVYADLDTASLASVVITEDVVAEGATFLDPLSEYTVDQTAQSLTELARLHAATWMDPAVGAAKWLDPWLHRLGKSRGVAEISYNFDGPIGAGVPEAVRDAQRLYDAYDVVAREAVADEPWAVIHGDTHVANLFVDANGRPSLLDWQLTQRGPWYLDVGYHLAATLPVEVRRRTEEDLLDHYLDRLAAGGVTLDRGADVWQSLGRGMVHGFYLWGITMKVDPPITTALLERLGTAVDDHGALDGLA